MEGKKCKKDWINAKEGGKRERKEQRMDRDIKNNYQDDIFKPKTNEIYS